MGPWRDSGGRFCRRWVSEPEADLRLALPRRFLWLGWSRVWVPIVVRRNVISSCIVVNLSFTRFVILSIASREAPAIAGGFNAAAIISIISIGTAITIVTIIIIVSAGAVRGRPRDGADAG